MAAVTAVLHYVDTSELHHQGVRDFVELRAVRSRGQYELLLPVKDVGTVEEHVSEMLITQRHGGVKLLKQLPPSLASEDITLHRFAVLASESSVASLVTFTVQLLRLVLRYWEGVSAHLLY